MANNQTTALNANAQAFIPSPLSSNSPSNHSNTTNQQNTNTSTPSDINYLSDSTVNKTIIVFI